MRNLDKIPIFIDGKIKLITPIIDNYKIITDYEEYTLTKTFKNKSENTANKLFFLTKALIGTIYHKNIFFSIIK